MYLQNLKIKSKGLLLIFCLTVACLTISTLMSSTKVHAASLKSSVTAEGMKDHGIEIEKAEFCKSKDRVDFGYKGIYGFVYLRLKGAPDGATYKITRCNAGYDHNNFWIANMPPAHGFSWQIMYSEGETIDIDVYDSKGEQKLATFTQVPLRIIDCDKPVVPQLEEQDGGKPELVTCDYFSSGPVGSTKSDNPKTVEHHQGYVYIRVKNITNAAKFDVQYNKCYEAANGQPERYTPTKSKQKGFIGVMPTAKVYKKSNPVEIEVRDNSYEDTTEQQRQKKAFPLTVYIYDKDDKLLQTFENVYPRIVSKYDHISCPGNKTKGGLETGQLNILVQETYSLNPSEYTKDSMGTLIDLRTEAERLVATRKGSQAQVNSITRKLFEARKNLVPIGSEPTPTVEWEFNKETHTICKYNGNKKNITIPKTIDNELVFHIGENAFKDKGIDVVTMPTSVKSIGKHAFEGNNLQSVIIPNSVEIIGEGAFKENRLSALSFETTSKVATIEKDAFRSNALKDVTLPASIKIVGDTAFAFNQFEDDMLKIDTEKSKVNFSDNALDKNTANKDKRVRPKFLRDAGTIMPQEQFQVICVLENAKQAESFTMTVINQKTKKEYQPIKKTIINNDGVQLIFDIPVGEYAYKEHQGFFTICDCGKPKSEREKIFNFTGNNRQPLTLSIRGWENWSLVNYAVTPEMKVSSHDLDDPDCPLRAIVKKGDKLTVSQLPKFTLNDEYEFIGWKIGDKIFKNEELTQNFKVQENCELLAVIKNKLTGSVITAGKNGEASTIIPGAPSIITKEDGSVSIIPPKDTDLSSITVNYLGENGNRNEIVANKIKDEGWKLEKTIDGIAINGETGIITIAEEAVQDNSQVTAKVKNSSGKESALVEATVKTKPNTLNKQPLENKIAEAEKITQGKKTDQAFKALQEAIKAAKESLKTVKTNDEVTGVVNALSQAIKVFNNSSEKDVVNKSDLKTQLDAAEAIKPEGYTKASFEAMVKAKNAAQAIYENNNATQEAVDQAKTNLQKAIAALEKEIVADKKPLENKIAEVEKITQGKKTDQAFKALQEAIKAAKESLKTVKTNDDISQAVKVLEQAEQRFYNSADKVDPKPYPTPSEPTKPEVKPQPGKTQGYISSRPSESSIKEQTKQPEIRSKQLETQGINFTDTIGHWAKHAIDYVVEKGYFKGVGNDQFAPNKSITRGDFVTVLGRMAGIDQSKYTSNPFSDLENNYATAYIIWAAENDIVKGVGNGKFESNRPITREEMAVVMSRYLYVTGKTLQDKQDVPFNDQSDISPWAQEAVKDMAKKGIVQGMENRCFSPKTSFTRAQVAQVLFNLDKQ